MDELLNTVERTYAEYCRARGHSQEEEARAFKAYQDAVKAVEKAKNAQQPNPVKKRNA